MPTYGKTINLYLMDGKVNGRWEARLSNWNGIAYKIPHEMVKRCDDLSEISDPGVYLLFGIDDETGKSFVYVGEADDALKRLRQYHGFDKNGQNYWTEAVVFTTTDHSLEKGRVKYLENRLYTLAKQAKRYLVKNGNTPKKSPVPRQIQDQLEEFILYAKLILPALGHKVLEPLASSDNDNKEDEIFIFAKNHGKVAESKGKISSDGFWVLKGSYIYPNVAAYLPDFIKRKREEYTELIDKNNILKEDIPFPSPSSAAMFVYGRSSNGLTDWRNKDGIPLKQLDYDKEKIRTKQSKKRNQRKTKAVEDQPKEIPAEIKASDTKVEYTTDKDLLYFIRGKGKKNKVVKKAFGRLLKDGFLVLKGSEIEEKMTPSAGKGAEKARKKYAYAIDNNGILLEDIFFKTPSAASTFVCGRSSSGLADWKNKEGVCLRDLMETKQVSGDKNEPEENSPQVELNDGNEEGILLYFSSKKGGKAFGKFTKDRFWVLKGSTIYPEVAPYLQSGIKKARLQYADAIDENGILKKDIPFKSPSTAAAFVSGKSCNGWDDWKDKDGVPMKKLGIRK